MFGRVIATAKKPITASPEIKYIKKERKETNTLHTAQYWYVQKSYGVTFQTDGFKSSMIVQIEVRSESTRVVVVEKRFETSKSSIG